MGHKILTRQKRQRGRDNDRELFNSVWGIRVMDSVADCRKIQMAERGYKRNKQINKRNREETIMVKVWSKRRNRMVHVGENTARKIQAGEKEDYSMKAPKKQTYAERVDDNLMGSLTQKVKKWQKQGKSSKEINSLINKESEGMKKTESKDVINLSKGGSRDRDDDKRRDKTSTEKPTTPTEETSSTETINLTPEVGKQEDGSILLNKPQEKEEFTTGDKLKALGTGAVIGAGLGFGAVAIGAGGIAAGASLLFGKATAVKAAFSKLLSHTPAIGKSATITVKGVTSKISDISGTYNWANVANNAKNFALKKSYLQKLAATAKNPKVVLGILASTLYTSLFWAPNEKGDALTTLTIAQRTALQNGDAESVLEINEMIQEVNDIAASIPVIGFIKAELAKFKAAAKSSQVSVDEAIKIMEEQAIFKETGETEFQRERRESDEMARERKLAEREEDTAFFEKQKAEREEEEATKKEKEKADALVMQDVWRLRREGNFDEADELERSIL